MNIKLISVLGVIVFLGMVLFASGTLRGSSKEIPINTELVDANNNPVNFSSFKGRAVFVNNWASWCPPCVAEMSSIQKLKNDLNDKDLVFIMVSFDEDRSKALNFMKRKGYDFKVLFPGDKFPYFTESIPATFIIDREGKIVKQYIGMQDYNKKEIIDLLKSL